MKFYLKLLRPNHWIKNLILFLPILLSTHLNVYSLLNLLIGFVSFSFLASGGYILNDIRDIEKDRLHQKKKYRPIANADVKINYAFFISIILTLFAFILSYKLGIQPFLFTLLYFILNYFYSVIGKTIKFIDILLLSSFYILRIYFGAIISNVPLTGWFMATFTFAVLSLSINKRYMECKNSEMYQIPGRGYNSNDKAFLKIIMLNFAIASIILLNIHSNLVLKIQSSLFFILLNITGAAIILFYFDDTKDSSEDPVERILNNKWILFFILFFLIIYFFELSNQFK